MILLAGVFFAGGSIAGVFAGLGGIFARFLNICGSL